MSVLIYKILLGCLVIAVIMAMLDRSILIFIEENMPFVKEQHESFINKKVPNQPLMEKESNGFVATHKSQYTKSILQLTTKAPLTLKK